VRRNFLADRYAPLIEGLYGPDDKVYVETQVTFEDGRKGMVKAEIAIRGAALAKPPPLKKAG